ncbi:rhodanese-like domain-containing protein [Sneathiella aquimaris]|uniref:rhodanese-like domain-containing protein n=1 Tax=Sneathiella aquimaris TaxID=2599305 RepID=UPI00146DF1E5|nr:rhodanese-like domain-containing protein [Sneathiella aquimaris]
MSFETISPAQMQQKLASDAEVAFLDVREQGVYAQGHPLWATSMPLSRLELEAERKLPRKSVDICLIDQGDGDGLSVRAAQTLAEMGFTSLSILDGGILGWHGAGFEIFSGVNVPSKAFGEFVEHHCGTPHITADELKQRLEADENIVVFDSRPFDEYHRMSIPGAIDMPGAELVHRVFETVTDEKTTIVVNCAGRTRSIIGAQSLINAGIKNPVMALKDGTMGWYLAGHNLANHANTIAPEPSRENLDRSVRAARTVGVKAGVELLEKDGLLALQRQAEEISLFVLDVRTIEDFAAGHIPGSHFSPGGQLVQATDEYVAVKNAHLVLVDDREVRAWMSASWLKQIGWSNVFVLTDLRGFELASGRDDQTAQRGDITPLELDAVNASGEAAAVLDLANSLAYRKSHIPGSYWIIRSRIAEDLNFLPLVGYIVITADDERLAHLAVRDVKAARPLAIVHVLTGGNEGWRQAGLPTEEGDTRLLSKQDDLWYKPYDNREKIRQRMQEYLDWEVALVPQVERDGNTRFSVLE